MTIDYLESDGHKLIDLAQAAGKLPGELDAHAFATRCKSLRSSISRQYPSKELLKLIQGLPDPQAGRFMTNQVGLMIQVLQSCHVNDRKESQRAAGLAKRNAASFEERVRELREK